MLCLRLSSTAGSMGGGLGAPGMLGGAAQTCISARVSHELDICCLEHAIQHCRINWTGLGSSGMLGGLHSHSISS